MNKQDLELKRLAEKYFYLNQKLTKQEYDTLKKTKYGKLLPPTYVPTSQFDKLVESLDLSKPTTSKPPVKRRRLNLSVDQIKLDELISNVEERFDIGVENQTYGRYGKINLTELRKFIKKQLVELEIDRSTANCVNRIINDSARNVYSTLHGLYLCMY